MAVGPHQDQCPLVGVRDLRTLERDGPDGDAGSGGGPQRVSGFDPNPTLPAVNCRTAIASFVLDVGRMG
jgi:hypothetical protein